MLLDRRLALYLSIALVLNMLALDGFDFFLEVSNSFLGMGDTYVLFFKYTYHWGMTEIGIVLSFSGILMAATQGFGIRLIVPKIGERRSSMICQTFSVVNRKFIEISYRQIFTFPMGFHLGWALLAPFMVLNMPGNCVTPILQALITKEYDEKSQGELLGVLSGLKTLSAFIGPFIANNLFAFFISEKAPVKIPGIAMMLASVLYAISFCVMWRAYRCYPERNEEEKVSSNVEDENLIENV